MFAFQTFREQVSFLLHAGVLEGSGLENLLTQEFAAAAGAGSDSQTSPVLGLKQRAAVTAASGA